MFKFSSSLVLSLLATTTTLTAASAPLEPSHPTPTIPHSLYSQAAKSEQNQPPCDPNLPGCPHNNTPEDQCAPGIPGCPHTYRCDDRSVCPRPGTAIGERAVDLTWDNTKIPYLLNPRFTSVLPSQPLLLRWQAVANATRYQVTVLDGSDEVWSWETDATQLQYAGPALATDVEYSVEILAYGDDTEAPLADSYADPSLSVFTVLTLQQEALILAQIEAIRQEGLELNAQDRKTAQIYFQNGLFLDGINQLTQLWERQPTPNLALRLGGFYFHELLLPLEARHYYQAVLEPQHKASLEERAIALTQLGYIQKTLTEYESALEHWQEALMLYQQLGKPTEIPVLEGAIDDIKQTLQLLEQN